MVPSSRRALFASAAALPVLAASARVPVGAEVAIADADAELLHLATAARAIARRLNAPDLVADEDADAEVARMNSLVARMVSIPAAGLVGVAAKAGRICDAVLACDGDEAFPIVVSLVSDLARLLPGTVSPAAAEPDAGLLALHAELRERNAAYRAAVEASASAEAGTGAALMAQQDVLRRMAALPAMSVMGWAVKARRLVDAVEGGASVGDFALADSVRRDAARLLPGTMEPESPASGQDSALSDEAKVLRAAAEVHARVAAIQAADADTSCDLDPELYEELGNAYSRAVVALCETPARTPAAIREKAAALAEALHLGVVIHLLDDFEDRAECHELLAMSLARDIAVMRYGAP